MVSGNLTGSDEDETEETPMVQAWAYSPNRIDRAVWPAGLVHVEHPKLLYNQPAVDS
jgi:hypothetical protein